MKMLFGKPIHKTCNSLIKVNQAETDVETANKIFAFGQHERQADKTENDVKDIIGRRVADRRVRQNKTEQTYQNQNGRENNQRDVV